MENKFSENSEDHKTIYYCELCDYKCFMKQHIKQHNLTQRHIKQIGNKYGKNGKEYSDAHKYNCNCGKQYVNKSGLWKHKKKCKNNDILPINQENITENSLLKDLIVEVMNQNSELHKSILELCKQTQMQNSTISNNTNNNTNINNLNNVNNKTFNLNVFLNETCKDAMNITDFANSIQVNLTDLEKIGELGYVDGISKIIIDNLKLLDVTERPVHCSDFKRDVIYVKDANKWEKEGENNVKMKKLINSIVNKNIPLISLWKKQNPDCYKSDSSNSTKINKMIMEVMETDDSKKDKIIKKVAKEVIINKL
jgi:hypothetical protein